MEYEKRKDIINRFFNNYCLPVLERKGKASAGGTEDVNSNFKQAAINELGVSDLIVWWIYYFKQVWRLRNYIVNRRSGEEIKEMIVDLVNYPLILVSILVEKNVISEKDFSSYNNGYENE